VKKILVIISSCFMVLTFSSFAFAQNAVSQMATARGGQHLAQCAQQMNKGVSECAKVPECEHVME